MDKIIKSFFKTHKDPKYWVNVNKFKNILNEIHFKLGTPELSKAQVVKELNKRHFKIKNNKVVNLITTMEPYLISILTYKEIKGCLKKKVKVDRLYSTALKRLPHIAATIEIYIKQKGKAAGIGLDFKLASTVRSYSIYTTQNPKIKIKSFIKKLFKKSRVKNASIVVNKRNLKKWFPYRTRIAVASNPKKGAEVALKAKKTQMKKIPIKEGTYAVKI